MDLSGKIKTKKISLSDLEMKKIAEGQLRFNGKEITEIDKNPNWKRDNEISLNEYLDWNKWALDLLLKEYNMNRIDAEKELSWIELKYGVDIKK